MIFTSVSRLGDFMLTWPVISDYYKTTGEKAHFVLSDNFPLYKKIEKLIYLQEFTEKISYVNVGTDSFTDWKFDPQKFGIDGKYINFGFYSNLNICDYYMPNFHAKYHNLKVDNEFIINLGDDNKLMRDKEYSVWIDASPWRDEIGILKLIIPSDCIELKSDFISDAIMSKHAKNTYSTMGGFMIIMDLCNIPCNVYGSENLINSRHMYYRTSHDYYIIE